jgi:hypothetical protein
MLLWALLILANGPVQVQPAYGCKVSILATCLSLIPRRYFPRWRLKSARESSIRKLTGGDQQIARAARTCQHRFEADLYLAR